MGTVWDIVRERGALGPSGAAAAAASVWMMAVWVVPGARAGVELDVVMFWFWFCLLVLVITNTSL